MKEVRGNEVRVAGEVLYHANCVRFHEVKVIRGAGWKLGAEVGRLKSDGHNIEGNGSDDANPAYGWSFQRR